MANQNHFHYSPTPFHSTHLGQIWICTSNKGRQSLLLLPLRIREPCCETGRHVGLIWPLYRPAILCLSVCLLKFSVSLFGACSLGMGLAMVHWTWTTSPIIPPLHTCLQTQLRLHRLRLRLTILGEFITGRMMPPDDHKGKRLKFPILR